LQNTTQKSLVHTLKSSLTAVNGYLQLIEANLQVESIDREKLIALVNKAKDSCHTLENRLESVEKDSK
jgi:hypothetical protein